MHAIDRLLLDRAEELAARACGNTAPNPPVGAVVASGERVLGEGYHHRAGEAHAEVHALRAAGDAAHGATLYVTLEPCNHHGRTPPCAQAVVDAGIARVVVGAMDPNPRTAGGGVAHLREAGIAVDVVDDPQALALIEPFSVAIRAERPYVALKLAASLDGYIAAQPGRQEWLTGAEARAFVRDLRIAYDAAGVGAGTVRVDDPQLTVRPAHHRLQPYRRVVFCETAPVPNERAIFAPADGYGRTVVLAPAGARAAFAPLEAAAEVVFAGAADCMELDLAAALHALRERGITSLLCEGGPTLAARLLERRLVDRLYWLTAPRLLQGRSAVPALAPVTEGALPGIDVDRVERLGGDVLVSAKVLRDV